MSEPHDVLQPHQVVRAYYLAMVHAERLTPALGAELSGLTAESLGDDQVTDALYKSLIEHQVVFLRDADLGQLDLVRLGESLGSLGARHHSYVNHPDTEDVVVLTWQGDDKPDAAEWHSDMTYRGQPPFASILQGIEIPPVGGDTLWASMHSVYESMSAGLKSELAELEAVHDMGAFRPGPMPKVVTTASSRRWARQAWRYSRLSLNTRLVAGTISTSASRLRAGSSVCQHLSRLDC